MRANHDDQVTRSRLDELYQHCADLGIDVAWRDLGQRRGEYRDAERLIVLNPALTEAQVVASLAHELGHCRFRDTCSTPRNERRAWQYAAALLLTPHEYRRAELLVGPHAGAMAVELGVTVRLIEAWRDWWQTRGRHLHSTLDGVR